MRPVRIVAVIAVVLAVLGVMATFQTTSTDPGFTAVVRNGGPFDSKDIRQIVPPASGVTWTGWFSTVHEYPVTERYTNVVPGEEGADPSKGDTVDVDAYRTQTRDGVDVGVVGQFKFVLNTADDPAHPDDPQLSPLRAFDTAYGQRTYAVPGNADGKRVSPWDGDEGFATFLAVQVRPVAEETLRQVLGSTPCVQLVASCGVLQAADPGAAAAALANAPDNGATFQKVADQISTLMATKVNASLGGPYLSSIHFSLTSIDLPPALKEGIGRVQTQQAATAEANGRAQQAAADATANENRQRGYNSCPTCAQIDQIKAQGDALAKIPSGVQVYAPGSSAAINVGPR